MVTCQRPSFQFQPSGSPQGSASPSAAAPQSAPQSAPVRPARPQPVPVATPPTHGSASVLGRVDYNCPDR